MAVSGLLACGHVHHHLVRQQKRTRAALIVDSAEASLVHHFCLLVGYGADAVCPRLAFSLLQALQQDGRLPAQTPLSALRENYIQVHVSSIHAPSLSWSNLHAKPICHASPLIMRSVGKSSMLMP